MAKKTSLVSRFWGSPKPTHYDDGTIASVGIDRRPRDIRGGRPVHHSERRYAIPRNPISYITLYQTMFLSLPWRFSINIKIQEKYRRGIEVVPIFSAKCKECRCEFNNLSPGQQCPTDGCMGELRGPDRKEKKRMENQAERMNINNESLEDILQQSHVDICVTDEGYILMKKKYYSENKIIKWSEVEETYWGSPIVMRPVVNPHTGTPGGMFWVCPNCRGKAKVYLQSRLSESPSFDVDYSGIESDEVLNKPPYCTKCGLRYEDVKYVSVFHERGYIENYYIEGEVIHWHEYMKSHTFSVPPGITLWVPATIIIYKDTWIRDSYRKQRKPKGAIIAITSNPDDFWNKWEEVMLRVKKDWHYTPMIPMEPEPGVTGGKGSVQWVDLMGDMKDLDYEAIRNIYERNIYQWYGVGNIFANIEAGQSGKGSSEAKLIISNRHREWSNRNDNRILRILSDSYGYKDHIWKIKNPEDRDELKDEQIFIQRSSSAQLVEKLGYKAILNEENQTYDFVYDPQKELGRAMDLINQLIQLKMAGSQPPPMDDTEDEENDDSTMKPKVDSSEFSGQATDGDVSGIDKAVGDKRMHEGDTKPTPASSHDNNSKGTPSDGYYAPDGKGPFKSKQALGGYLRTKGNQQGQGMGPGGGSSDGPPNGDNEMEQPQADKEDYKKALKLVESLGMIREEIVDIIRQMIEEMDDANGIKD